MMHDVHHAIGKNVDDQNIVRNRALKIIIGQRVQLVFQIIGKWAEHFSQAYGQRDSSVDRDTVLGRIASEARLSWNRAPLLQESVLK